MAERSPEVSILQPVAPVRARGVLGVMDRVLPGEIRSRPDELRRGRLFLVMNTILVLSAFFFAWESTPDGGRIDTVSIILAAGGVLCLLNLPLAWMAKSVRLPALVACTELILVVLAAGWFGGGIGDPSQWFLLIAPLLATFLVGPRAGVAAALIASAGEVGLFVAEENGVAFSPPGGDEGRFHALGASIVIFTVAGFSALYEATRSTSLHLVEKAMRELRGKNLELEGLARAISDARDQAIEESARKDAFLARMRTFARTQGEALEKTRQATHRLAESIRAISASVETLASSGQASDASIAGMADSAARATQTANDVVAGVQETNRALEALTAAVTAVQEHVDNLGSSAQTTAAAMREMEQWASRIEKNAARTVALSDEMIRDAERGHDAVRRTLDGVDTIRDTARLAGAVIRSLDQRVSAIGVMNNVIDEVAVETNVLALNASIIAAQAGENGQGFAVVADQIKALAARTAGSTKDIAGVIRAAQEEARNAVDAIAKGEEAVESGLSLSEEAAKALALIVASARQATDEVRGIEQATVAQARRARDVGEAMGEVTRLLAAAVRATHEHGQSAGLIEDAMARLRSVAPDLEARSQQQAEGARQARASIARISEMARKLSAVQGEQNRASEETLRAIEEIQRAQRGQEEALRSLSE